MTEVSKVFFANTVDNTSLVKGLVNNGVLLKFGSGGKYLGESPVSFALSGLVEIDVISILTYNGEIEVAYNVNGVLLKRSTELKFGDLVSMYNKIEGIVFAGRKQGEADNISFTQYIYGFRKGVLSLNTLMEVLG